MRGAPALGRWPEQTGSGRGVADRGRGRVGRGGGGVDAAQQRRGARGAAEPTGGGRRDGGGGDAAVAAMIGRMDRHGIVKAVVSSLPARFYREAHRGNDELFEETQAQRGRWIPVVTANPT